MLTIGSLFAGIGGLELGLELAGFGPVAWQVELDERRRGVLAKHWPDAERHNDVRQCGAHNLARVGIICGGFPCRGISPAGSRTGFAHPQTGLWREMLRIVSELRPRWVVVENVDGGVEWVERVSRDLSTLGYSSLPIPVSAAALGAPHERPRRFIVANADSQSEPLGAFNAQVAGICATAGRLPEWSERPPVGVDDGIHWAMAALGDAVVPRCAEVAGWVIRELEAI